MPDVAAEKDTRAWYERPYRIVQTNMRLPDIARDPQRMARQVREFGGDATIVNVGGIYAFYPTDLDLQGRNPMMRERQDFVRDMVLAGRAEGLTMIGRFDLSKAQQPAWEAHPDWFVQTRAGGPLVYEGAYQACPNGGWARGYGQQILREALTRYELDGVFFNMPGYPRPDYAGINHGSCVCDNCRRRFREMYGLSLPETDGFADPVWPQYLEFQARTADELAKLNYEAIKQTQPSVAVMGWHPRNEVVRYEVQRRVARPAPEWAFQSGEQARLWQARIPDSPFSSTSTTHIDYPWRQVLETSHYHLLRFAQQIANGAQLDLYLMGTFDDQDDNRFEQPVSDLFRWYGDHAAHYDGLRPAARVALYESQRTARYAGGIDGGAMFEGAWRGGYTALVDQRVPFWMVGDERIADGTTKLSPEHYDAIVLTNISVMTDEEGAALDEYVRAGGLVIATGNSGAFDGTGTVRNGSAMESSPVGSFGASVPSRGWTLDAATMREVSFDPVRILLDGPYFPVRAKDDARNLMGQAPLQRYGPPELSFALPDAAPGEEPGILVRSFGQGTAVHIPWLPEALYYRHGLPDHACLLKAIIEAYAPPPPFRLEGGGPVEMTVMQQADGRKLVHLVNYSGQRNGLYDRPATIAGLRLGLREGLCGQALVAGGTHEAGQADADGYRWIDLPLLGGFEALVID